MSDNVDQAKLNEAKELFISIAAHKLLTPLTLIKWNLELLNKDESMQVSSKEKLKDITESVQKLDRFSNILLKIVQIKADSGSLAATEKKSFKIDVDRAIEKGLIDLKELKFEKHSSIVNPIDLTINEDELAFIINNLAENSMLYNTAEKKLILKTGIEDGNVVLVFEDDGIGIPEKERVFIGDAFFRTSNSQKLSVKGFGLSLYLIKLMLENNGGSLQIKESELEKGSVFEVKIPLANN